MIRMDNWILIARLYYTSALWNIVADRVKHHRENLEIHKIKMMVPVGAGTTPTLEEEQLLLQETSLIRYTPDNMDVSIKCTSAEIFEILDVSPTQINWQGEGNQECSGQVLRDVAHLDARYNLERVE